MLISYKSIQCSVSCVPARWSEVVWGRIPDLRPVQTTQPVLQTNPRPRLKVITDVSDASILAAANMAAYSLIFTIAGWWFGLIDSSKMKIFPVNVKYFTKRLRAKPSVLPGSAVSRLREVRGLQIRGLGQADRETPALPGVSLQQ